MGIVSAIGNNIADVLASLWQGRSGIELIPEARGHGYGSEAQAQLAAYLFATSDVNRVEAATDLENVAEQRSLEKAGFRREGVLRGSQFRAGRYHDLVYYAILREDIGLSTED